MKCPIPSFLFTMLYSSVVILALLFVFLSLSGVVLFMSLCVRMPTFLSLKCHDHPYSFWFYRHGLFCFYVLCSFEIHIFQDFEEQYRHIAKSTLDVGCAYDFLFVSEIQ